jgi:hypothetical protein
VSNDERARERSWSGEPGARRERVRARVAAPVLRVRSHYRVLVGGLLVVAVAAAGIALNFALLGSTQENSDPVGRLSPRAIFDTPASTTEPSRARATPEPIATDGVRGVTDGSGGRGSDDGTHVNDDDD